MLAKENIEALKKRFPSIARRGGILPVSAKYQWGMVDLKIKLREAVDQEAAAACPPHE